MYECWAFSFWYRRNENPHDIQRFKCHHEVYGLDRHIAPRIDVIVTMDMRLDFSFPASHHVVQSVHSQILEPQWCPSALFLEAEIQHMSLPFSNGAMGLRDQGANELESCPIPT